MCIFFVFFALLEYTAVNAAARSDAKVGIFPNTHIEKIPTQMILNYFANPMHKKVKSYVFICWQTRKLYDFFLEAICFQK